MIIVIAHAVARPDQLEALSGLLTDTATASRADPGCISYGYFADLAEPNTFVAVERWESREHLADHLRTPHVAELASALQQALVAPPTATVYEVASEGPLL